jgi:hypothetical protein
VMTVPAGHDNYVCMSGLHPASQCQCVHLCPYCINNESTLWPLLTFGCSSLCGKVTNNLK